MFKANFLGNVGSVKGNDQAEPGQGFLPSKEPKFVGELNKETIRLGVEATKWNIWPQFYTTNTEIYFKLLSHFHTALMSQ